MAWTTNRLEHAFESVRIVLALEGGLSPGAQRAVVKGVVWISFGLIHASVAVRPVHAAAGRTLAADCRIERNAADRHLFGLNGGRNPLVKRWDAQAARSCTTGGRELQEAAARDFRQGVLLAITDDRAKRSVSAHRPVRLTVPSERS